MFIIALFTIAKLWKQPRCPTSDEWIMKLWYIYTMEYYSVRWKYECDSKPQRDITLNLFGGLLQKRKIEEKIKNRKVIKF
jgi:hypothetical protein